MRIVFSICVMVLTAFGVRAQVANVPANANSVLVFDMGRLQGRVDLKKIQNGNFLKPEDSLEYGFLDELFKRIVGNMENAGVDTKRKLVIFNNFDTSDITGYLIPVSQPKKMQAVIEQFNAGMHWETDKLRMVKEKDVIYYLSPKKRLGVALNKNLCILLQGDYDYYYNYDEGEYEQALDSMKNTVDSIRASKGLRMLGWPRKAYYSPYEPAPAPVDEFVPDTTSKSPEGDGTEEPVVAETPFEKVYDNSGVEDSILQVFNAWWDKRRAEKEKAFWIGRETWYKTYSMGIFQNDTKKSGLQHSNSSFASKAATPADMLQWIDLSFTFRMMVHESQRYRYYDESYNRVRGYDSVPYEQTPLGKYLGNLTITGIGSFDNGNAKLKYHLDMSDSVKGYMGRFMGTPVSREMFNYIKSPEYVSLSSQNTSFRAMAELYMNGQAKFRETMAQRSQGTDDWMRIAMIAHELVFAFMDKDMLYNTFSGASVSAVTGTINVKSAYQSWSYDDEGNYKPEIKYAEHTYPRFVSVFEIKNTENLNKILMPFVNNGYLVKKNNAYFIRDRFSMLPVYLLVNGNHFIVTNDSLYRDANYLKLPCGLDAAVIDRATSSPVYVEMDGKGTGSMLKEFAMMRPREMEKTEQAVKTINRIYASADKEPGNFTISAEFANKTHCSLLDLIELTKILTSK